MSTGFPTWRARLRFRIRQKLNVDTNEHRLRISGRDVVLAAPRPDAKICESEWLVMNARGFSSEEEALRFGTRLKAALELSAVAARVGIDAGHDHATLQFSKGLREATARSAGADLRDNIHGLDVFPDNPNALIIDLTATGTELSNPHPFLTDLDELVKNSVEPSQRLREVVLLMNYALILSEPVAQVVMAVAAVESLSHGETWTTGQKELLAAAAEAAERSTEGTPADREEVACAIRRMHRLSLRQSVFRLLDRFELAHLRKRWDELYTERSTLVHGLKPKPGENYADLANRTVSLCGQIVLKAIAVQVPIVDRHSARFYGG